MINAGGDVTLAGSQVKGKRVELDAENLNIESLQDKSSYHGKQMNASGSVSANFETPFGENGAAQSTKQATDKDGNLLYTDKNGNTTVNSKGVNGQENTKKLAEGKESLQFSYGMGYGYENIYNQFIYSDEDGYENVYSFAHTSEGNWLCFDYRDCPTTSEPKISLVIHDEYNDEIGKWLILPVANNFDDFLDSLYDFNERYPD